MRRRIVEWLGRHAADERGWKQEYHKSPERHPTACHGWTS
jgi:hypothetical protein